MQQAKTIFVTGATGNLGGAVARNLLLNGFKIKALTRDSTSTRAQHLKRIGAEIIEGDLDQPDTFSDHLKGIDGIFSVLTFVNGIETEIKQGFDLADLAKANNIRHFIYSSVTGADLNTGVPHWESKFKIENHIKNIGIPYTIIRPASLFENFLIPQVKSRLLKGKLISPINKSIVQQFISADDIGKTTVEVFTNTSDYMATTITLASEELDLIKVARIFSEALGKNISYGKLPMFITRLVMGKNLYKMFKWINEHNAVFIKDFISFRNKNPALGSLQQWISSSFQPS